MSEQVTKPYRVLVGSFQQADENGQLNEFSRGDQIRLTEAEAAEHPGTFEPWGVVEPVAPSDASTTEAAEPAAAGVDEKAPPAATSRKK